MAPSRDIPAGVCGEGEWEKSSLSSHCGMARSRGKPGDFQRTKRLLAASVAGSGEGESPAPAPAGVGEKHKKHREFVFYLPGNPSSITGIAHRGSQAKMCCCRRWRVRGRRSGIPYALG